MQKPSVSIVTITQLNRIQSFPILIEIIKRQTYKNIIEWIIVEGSPNIEDSIKNKNLLDKYLQLISLSFQIKYIAFSGKKLGGLRNLANENCNGDIIVCFDDDDYYPPDRIFHCVNKLSKSDLLIGGVSDIYLYNFYFEKLFKFDQISKNHSTNNCFAYKKEYLKNHSYDSEASFAEEASFTNNFTEPMVQFNSKETIIVIAHNNNTFNKNNLCLQAINEEISYIKEIEKNINKFIPNDIFEKMKLIYL